MKIIISLIHVYCEKQHFFEETFTCIMLTTCNRMLQNISSCQLKCAASLKFSLQCNIFSRSAKGYIRSPVMGCYRLIKDAKLRQPDAKQRCAQDGGRLLLVNSAVEAQEVFSLLGMLLIFLKRKKFK